MAKVCLKEFPKGCYKGQQHDGYYMSDYLKHSLDTLTKHITNDMQFVGLVTGNGMVRNGKSNLSFQVAYYYSKEISRKTKTDIPFTCNNIVFNADDLIKRAFELPKYSCLVLDEGDDLTAHHFSKLALKLKKFFRKCGQLNLFIILILPSFFELPRSYAISRSNFLINVKFVGEFERGFFDFFGPTAKRKLYFNGKKFENYNASSKSFHGRFVKLYTVDEKEYREMKRKDMEENEEEEGGVSGFQAKRLQKIEIVQQIVPNLPIKSREHLAKVMGTSKGNIDRMARENLEKSQTPKTEETKTETII